MDYFKKKKGYFLSFTCKIHYISSTAEHLTQENILGIANIGLRNILRSQYQMFLHLDLIGKCKIL